MASKKEILMLLLLMNLTLLGVLGQGQTDSLDQGQISYTDSCDLNLENGICLYDGNVVLTPPPTIDGLIMYLTYDQADAIDQSGTMNNAGGLALRGPGYFMSRGYSAHFQGEISNMVAPSDSINAAFADQFSVSFWLFTNSLGTLTTQQCAIIRKGNQSGRSFAFIIDVAARQFIVTTATTDGDTILASNGRLQLQRWTHIAITRSTNILTLYINGNLDAVAQTSTGAPTASRPLYIGRAPWQDAQGGGCSLDFYLDEFKVWNNIITEAWIEAEAGIALGAGIDPHSIELGCLSCSFANAQNSCTSGYHLCTTVEVYSFAFSAAKSMGWLRSGLRMWSDASTESSSSDTGLAICCRNYNN